MTKSFERRKLEMALAQRKYVDFTKTWHIPFCFVLHCAGNLWGVFMAIKMADWEKQEFSQELTKNKETQIWTNSAHVSMGNMGTSPGCQAFCCVYFTLSQMFFCLALQHINTQWTCVDVYQAITVFHLSLPATNTRIKQWCSLLTSQLLVFIAWCVVSVTIVPFVSQK